MDPQQAATLEEKIRRLQGPVLVLGGSGFVGANLLRSILKIRDDAYGTATRLPAWRLVDLPQRNLKEADLLIDSNLDALLDDVKPRTVFNCIAYGAYSFETEPELIYETNFNFTERLLKRLEARGVASYVHAGSSSEYGDNAAGPHEGDLTAPNSDYAVSKVAAANLIWLYGKRKKLPCCNLRLYSVYGPLEDASRLLPNVIKAGLANQYPPLVNPDVSRDFVYTDDVSEAFVCAALNLREAEFGESFNIGTGTKTTIRDVAHAAASAFSLPGEANFSMPSRQWDVTDWYASIDKARERLGWSPRVEFRDGFSRMSEWYRSIPDKEAYHRASKQFGLDTKHSVSAVIACRDHAKAVPIAYQRLRDVLRNLNIDYEIIFVDDASNDDTEAAIRAVSADDRRVVGVCHSRPFGLAASFRSGMEVASKNAVVLFDGALRDPPELIKDFVAKWREGYDVVYGRRSASDRPLLTRAAYSGFYRLFERFSNLTIPKDAGDFALMDRMVVRAMLRFPERDLFLAGVRAYAGFRQVGVDYHRGEPIADGRPDQGMFRKLGRGTRGILSFTNVPLNLLTWFGLALTFASVILGIIQVVIRIVSPHRSPSGVTTMLLAILFFGAINLLAIALIGEYVGKIFQEVKRRPHYIRRTYVREGVARTAAVDEAVEGDAR